ncbi:ubiquitin-conjugating enzyme E2 W-like [Paramacrobiotus metropolitanus]|uniref:ubiquitin-conjugating enzyme E2 W-like n=1 Tax=Paramacrobiotus metropolitanus TaxID=2943436 RepID=UPI0024455F8A|nr:ubiquitin-conjugating enzyme E2 W-like [Paramacrobiotus metropolitanus]
MSAPMAISSARRIQKEMIALSQEPIHGVTVKSGPEESKDHSCVEIVMGIKGAEGTIYHGEEFELRFRINERYPFESPEVVFQGSNIPLHPHVYSNGHICLSILGDEWSPALTIQSVCLSIVSMLSSCKEKKRPPDDQFYVRTASLNPKNTRWRYHDDSV